MESCDRVMGSKTVPNAKMMIELERLSANF